MIVQTDKDLGKWFTLNGNDKCQLVGTNYCDITKKVTVTLLFQGGAVVESMIAFKDSYKLTQPYPPKGSICECTYHTGGTFLKYSNGDGTYSSEKSGTERRPGIRFSTIKIIK